MSQNNEHELLASIARYVDLLWVALVAMFFGFVRYLQDFLVPNPPAFRWFIASAKALTSLAAGGLAYVVMRELGASENWRWVGISLAGWGGADGINAAKEAWLDWIRRKAAQAAEPGAKN